MKQALDRFYAVLALHEQRIDVQQLKDAYEAYLHGQADSLLHALAERGWLSDRDRGPLDEAVERQLLAMTDRILQEDGDAVIRALLRGDAAFANNWSTPTADVQTRGHYHLVEPCGEGGIGRVWLARDAVLDRVVALKELKPQTATEPIARARFLREARLTGRLQHPFVVPVHELRCGEELYYTMRLVRGATLAEAIAHHHENPKAPWDRPRLLTAFEQVCQAVAFAHAHGIVHRDLKPANIVLGDFGEVFVLDWGLAKELSGVEESEPDAEPASNNAEATRAGQVLGTPAYMSPEQAAGRANEVGPASDVYGLGAILFAILTGQSPHASWNALSPGEYLAKVAAGPVPRARSRRGDVPPPLDAVCARALAPAPAERYATAQELAEDVRRWVRGESVSAYREPWTLRFRRWTVRHRWLTLTAAVGLVAAAVAVTAFAVAATKDAAMVRNLAQKALENRADQFRTNILIELASVEQVAQAAVRSARAEEFVRQRGAAGPPAEVVTRLSDEWRIRLEQRPFCLALSLIDRDSGRILLRTERAAVGEPLRLAPPLPRESAIARLLSDELKKGGGPRFVEQAPHGAAQPTELLFLLASPVTVPHADCWLTCEVDFATLLRTMVEPMRHRDIELLLRDDSGRSLLLQDAAGDSPYARASLAGLDPRLVEFFSVDHAVSERSATDKMLREYRVLPIDPRNTLSLARCQPTNDIVFALKIRYNEEQPQRYLGLLLVAPYEKFLAQTAASRNFLIGLMGLIFVALSAIVLLAARLTAGHAR